MNELTKYSTIPSGAPTIYKRAVVIEHTGEQTTLKQQMEHRLKVIDKILKLTDANRQFIEAYYRVLASWSEVIHYDGVAFDREMAKELIARSKSLRRYRERRARSNLGKDSAEAL